MNCTACEIELTAIFEREDKIEMYQLDNALWIGLSGGYGMFVDGIDAPATKTLTESEYEAVICHDCAHEMFEKSPWLRKLFKPELSHSHSAEYWAAHPDHEGWDKKTN